MTSTHPQYDDSRPWGSDVPPSGRELDDLVTRHFDGGLDPAEQRRLAAMLDAAPAARETFARYLRLEGALIRLASAGLIGSSAGEVEEDAAVIPRPRADVGSSPWLRTAGAPGRRLQGPAALALAGCLLASVVIAVLLIGRPESEQMRGGDVAVIADRWLEVRAADGVVEPDGYESEEHDPETDETDRMAGSPPDWLVAAVADDGAGRSGPGEG